MMFWMGVFPQTFLRKMDASVVSLVNRIHSRERVYVKDGRPRLRIEGAPAAALEGASRRRTKPGLMENGSHD